MQLQVSTVSQPNGVAVVKVVGTLALGRESQRVEATVQDLIAHGTNRIVMDLGGVEQMDSTGVGIVTYCYGQVKEAGGKFRVAEAKGKIREGFRITSVDALVPFDPDLDTSIAAAGAE